MAWSKSGNIKGSPGQDGTPGQKGDKGDPGVPAPSQVVGSQAGTVTALTLWVGTQAQYNAVAVKDPLTVYVVT